MTLVRCFKGNCSVNKDGICQEPEIKVSRAVSIQWEIIAKCRSYDMNPYAKGYNTEGVKIS